MPEIKVYSTSKDLAENAAMQLHSLITLLLENNEKLNIAFSGGSTPSLLFSVLADEYRDKISWDRIHLFWVDERCVPPENPESNYGVTRNILLDKIPIPEENIHRIKGEAPPLIEAERYSAEINNNLKKNNNLPEFDIILLGIGEDGHTASIFPDRLDLLNSEKVCVVTVHPQSGQERITLTGRIINNCKEIIFLISGRSKATALSRILNKEKDAERLPAFYINNGTDSIKWWVDREALPDKY